MAVAGGADRSFRPARLLAPAGCRLAGRADRPDADAGVLRRPRRRGHARHDHHGRHRTWHEPRQRDDGRLQAREGRDRRPWERRRSAPSRDGRRAHRGVDAHEPVHARALRRAHRGDRRDLPPGGSASLLRRGEPERRVRDLTTGRHGLRHRPHQPPQDVLATARRRRPRRRTDRRARQARAVPARPGSREGRRPLQRSTTTGRSRSARSGASPARSASSFARTPTSVPTVRACARCPRWRC